MKKLMFGILMAFGLVSVSMGAYIPKSDEKNYQKLKAEVEEWDDKGKCDELREDGTLEHNTAFYVELKML